MMNQARLRSFRRGPFWKFRIPRTHAKNIELDNGNAKQQDGNKLIRELLISTIPFCKGVGGVARVGYKTIT